MEFYSEAGGLDAAVCSFVFEGKAFEKEDTPEALGMQSGAKVYMWAKEDAKAERRAKKYIERES